MATTTGEQEASKSTESCFTNDDPELPKIFPEELTGWHGWVTIHAS